MHIQHVPCLRPQQRDGRLIIYPTHLPTSTHIIYTVVYGMHTNSPGCQIWDANLASMACLACIHGSGKGQKIIIIPQILVLLSLHPWDSRAYRTSLPS